MKHNYKKIIVIAILTLIFTSFSVVLSSLNMDKMLFGNILNNNNINYGATYNNSTSNFTISADNIFYEYSFINDNGEAVTSNKLKVKDSLKNSRFSASSDLVFYAYYKGNIKIGKERSALTFSVNGVECGNISVSTDSDKTGYGFITIDASTCNLYNSENQAILIYRTSSTASKENVSFTITNVYEARFINTQINDSNLKGAIDNSQIWNAAGTLVVFPENAYSVNYYDIANNISIDVIDASNNNVSNEFEIRKDISFWNYDQNVYRIPISIQIISKANQDYTVLGNYKIRARLNNYSYYTEYYLPQILDINYINGIIDTSNISATKYIINHDTLTPTQLRRYKVGNDEGVIEFNNKTFNYSSSNYNFDAITKAEFDSIKSSLGTVTNNGVSTDSNGYFVFRYNFEIDGFYVEATITKGDDYSNKVNFNYYIRGVNSWLGKDNLSRYEGMNCYAMTGDTVESRNDKNGCLVYQELRKNGYNVSGNTIVKELTNVNIPYSNVINGNYTLTGPTEFDYEKSEKIMFNIPSTTTAMNDRIYSILNSGKICSTSTDTNCYEILKNVSTGTATTDGKVLKVSRVRKGNGKSVSFELIYHENDEEFNTDEYGNYSIKFRIKNSLHDSSDFVSFSIPLSKIDYYLFTTSGSPTYDDLVSSDVRNNSYYTFKQFDMFSEYQLSSETTSTNFTSDSGYTKFIDDLEDTTNQKYSNYLNNAYTNFIKLSEESDEDFNFNTLESYKSFYDYLDMYYKEYFDSGDEYISFNDVTGNELENYILYGPPSNVKESNLSLGFYATSGMNVVNPDVNDKVLLDSYNVLYKIFPHNVEKKAENQYRFYDSTRYKILVSDYNIKYIEPDLEDELSEEEIDWDNSTITFKVVEYKINSLIEENTTNYGKKTFNEFKTIIKDTYNFDINNAFVPLIEDENLNIGSSLIDHMVKDADGNVHFTYNTNNEYVSRYIERGQYPDNDTVKNGYLYLVNATTGTERSVPYVSTKDSYSDYYYIINNADVENTDVVVNSVTYNGFKPEYGAFVFNVKSYPDNNIMTSSELETYDIKINLTINNHCNSISLSKYSVSNSSVVCYNESTNDEYTYESLAAKNARFDELLKIDSTLLTEEENNEKNALYGICQTLEERKEWCSNSALDAAPLESIPGGTYFIFTGFSGTVDLDYTTDLDYFPTYMFPALSGNNSHMTKISYSDPLYVMTFTGINYGILGNNNSSGMTAAYTNVQNDIKIGVILNANDDNTEKLDDYISERIERFYKASGENVASWHALTEEEQTHFQIIPSYRNTIMNSTEESIVEIKTNGTIEEGKYRLVLKYDNTDKNFSSREFSQEFDVDGKYFNVKLKQPANSYFYRNVPGNINIDFLSSINVDFNNLKIAVKDEPITDDETMIIEIGKKEREQSSSAVFGDTYVVPGSVDGSYDVYRIIENSEPRHEFSFTFTENNSIKLYNVKNVADIGFYQLKVSYVYRNNIEDKRFITSSTIDFEIKDNRYLIEILEQDDNGNNIRPVLSIDETGKKKITFFVKCSYIDKDSLNKVKFNMLYYDEANELRNGTTYNPYPFTFETIDPDEDIDDIDEYNYVVRVTFDINEGPSTGATLLDYYGIKTYFFETSYIHSSESEEIRDIYQINNLLDLFKWKVSSANINASSLDGTSINDSLDETEINNINNGYNNKELIFYNNLKNQSLYIGINTFDDTPIGVSIDGAEGNIISNTYNSYFNIENNSGKGNTTRSVKLNYLSNYNHVVVEGDTPNKLASKYGIDINDMLTYCNTSDKNKQLNVGDEISIPSVGELQPGRYRVRLYYTSGYKDINIRVVDKYVGLNILSMSSTDMFKNKEGHLDLELSIVGIENPYENVSIVITDPNGTNANEYFENRYVDQYNKVHIIKPSNANMMVGNYIIKVKYTSEDGTFNREDSRVFQVGSTYFTYDITLDKTVPNYLVKNEDVSVYYKISTDKNSGITLGFNSVMNAFINNTKVYKLVDGESVLQTGKFIISANRNTDSSIDLVITNRSNIDTGIYYIKTSYTFGGFTLEYNSRDNDGVFVVNDSVKAFAINSVEYLDVPDDEKLHYNLDWKIKYNLISSADIVSPFMSVKVVDASNHDVTDHFSILKHIMDDDMYVTITYDKNNPLPVGNYYTSIIYDEDTDVQPYIQKKEFKIDGSYKQLQITELGKSNTPLYADRDNQSYSLLVNTDLLTEDDIDNLYLRILDSKNNIVYSNTPTDNITDSATINNTITTDGKIVVNLKPFKFRVGTYYVEICISHDIFEGEYRSSNKLSFDIEETDYNVTLNDNSYIHSRALFTDIDTIYDDYGINGHLEFTTDYAISDLDVFSIAIYNDLKLYDIVETTFTNTDGVISADFIIPTLPYGEVEFAVCINGMPYTSIIKNVNMYIPLTKISLKVAGKQYDINSTITIPSNVNSIVDIILNPSSASNNMFRFEISDESILTYEDGVFIPHADGTVTVNVTNSEYSGEFTIKVCSELESSAYIVDNTNHIVYVPNDTNYRISISKSDFVKQFKNVNENEIIYTANSSNITNKIATGDVIEVYGNTYTIVFRGECNGDGLIGSLDYIRVRKRLMSTSTITNTYQKLAEDANGDNNVTSLDYVRVRKIIMNGKGA